MPSRSLFTRLLALAAAGGLALACSPSPQPASLSPSDPSSPLASEGESPLALSRPASAPTGHDGPHAHGAAHAHHAHGHHAHGAAPAGEDASPATADGGAQGVVYVCPMDPEITSSTPGVCPKCNMKLVPKK
ncbi:MAG: hypothetical protein KF894_13160 [Labilithrix sp.]|nr:hypothetical protein [Labilithrix sp.]